MFNPLPAYLNPGAVTGPSGFAPGGKWAELCPMPEPLPAYPAGPSPMLPNPEGDRDTGGGDGNTWKAPVAKGGAEVAPGLNEKSDYDQYHDAMEDATGADFARKEPESSSGSSNSGESSGSGNRSNPDYDQAGVKEALAILERKKQEAREEGNHGLADAIQDQIDEQKRQIDVDGTPADQAGYWIEVGVAVASAFLPDPVGDAITAAVCSKAAAAVGGIIGKTIAKYGDEVYGGLSLTKHVPSGPVSVGDSAATAAAKAGIDIPDGYIVRRADNDAGWVWQHKDDVGVPGGENYNIVRVGAENSKNPTGYVRYYNETGQPLKPGGGTGSKTETHIPVGDEPIPAPPNWPKR